MAIIKEKGQKIMKTYERFDSQFFLTEKILQSSSADFDFAAQHVKTFIIKL